MSTAKSKATVTLTLVGLSLLAAAPMAHADHLYVVSLLTHAIMRYDAQTGGLVGALTVSASDTYTAMAYDPAYGLYLAGVSSTGALFIDRFDVHTGDRIARVLNNGPAQQPGDIAFDSTGRLYLSFFNQDKVERYNRLTGVLIDTFVTPGSGGLNGPTGLTFDSLGRLYVSSRITGQVLRYSTTGTFLGIFATPGGNGPQAPRFGPDGDLWLVNTGSHTIQRFDGTTGAFLGNFASVPSTTDGASLTFTGDGRVLVCISFNDNVRAFDRVTGTPLGDLFPTGRGGLDFPAGVLLVPACEGDLDHNGIVDMADFVLFQAAFGACP